MRVSINGSDLAESEKPKLGEKPTEALDKKFLVREMKRAQRFASRYAVAAA